MGSAAARRRAARARIRMFSSSTATENAIAK